MSIDRHPASLRALIRPQLSIKGWEIFEVSYDSIEEIEAVPLEEIDAVLMAPARHFPTIYLDRLTQCKIIQIWSSGYDKFNITDAHDREIPVANNHGSNAISVAEHAILLMLGVSRRAPEMHKRVTTGSWAGNDHGMTSYSVSGEKLGIVGLGNIGTLVAHRAEALGMGILFCDPGLDVTPTLSWEKTSFEDLCKRSDYITFHVHLSPEKADMLNLTNLGLLERHPFIVNVSRAELIEENALVFALKSGLIRGIAMDARYREPTTPPDQLLEFSNSFFSPHVAGSTVDSCTETLRACTSNISETCEGQPPKGILMPIADRARPCNGRNRRSGLGAMEPLLQVMETCALPDNLEECLYPVEPPSPQDVIALCNFPDCPDHTIFTRADRTQADVRALWLQRRQFLQANKGRFFSPDRARDHSSSRSTEVGHGSLVEQADPLGAP